MQDQSKKKWDRDDLLNSLSVEARPLAERIFAWASTHDCRIEPQQEKGKKYSGHVLSVEIGGRLNKLFKVTATGEVQFYTDESQWFQQQPPFAEGTMRTELYAKLKPLTEQFSTGADTRERVRFAMLSLACLYPDKTDKNPKLPLAWLKSGPAMDSFLNAFTWVVASIRECPATA